MTQRDKERDRQTERETEGERERERETDRQTDRQTTDRQTDRPQTDRQTDREREREREMNDLPRKRTGGLTIRVSIQNDDSTKDISTPFVPKLIMDLKGRQPNHQAVTKSLSSQMYLLI